LQADHIIDLGPEGGEKGGQVIATGTPEEVAKNAASYTGAYIAEMLKHASPRKNTKKNEKA
jgi:excinuclease ABC subunit A